MSRSVGRYRLERELGRGSFGVVYLARADGGEPVALKVLLDVRDPEQLARFEREGELAARLDHPAIVRVRARGVEQGRPWLAFDYCPGETLRERLQRGPLPVEQARELVDRVAAALEHAHARGVIHRDLKPANVLLDLHGRPHVTDFGLARDSSRGAGLTRSGDGLGSPLYMPPEQFSDAKHVDARADVYALGLLLYEALTARQPFEGTTVLEIAQAIQAGNAVPLAARRGDLPPPLVAACERACARERDERFPSVRAFREALAAPAPRARAADRGEAPRRSAAPLVLAGVAVGLALAGLAVVLGSLGQRGLAAQARLDEARTQLAAGELAGAQRAYAQAQAAGLEDPELAADLQAASALEAAEQALAVGDLGPARHVLSAPTPAALARRRAALERGLLAHEVDLSDALAVERVVRALREGGGGPERDVLAQRLLERARQRSRERASLEDVLALLEPAAQVVSAQALRDEVALEVASVHFRRGRLAEATALAQRLRARPGRIGLQARYVAAYGKVWQDPLQVEGLEELRALGELDPEGPVGLNASAVYNSHHGDNARGERLAARALELDPGYVDAHISLAFCRNDQVFTTGDRGFLDASLAASSAAIELMPDHPRAYLARAYALGNQGQRQATLDAYDQVIALTEPRPMARALRQRSQHRFAGGDTQGALEDLGRAIELYPRDGEAYALLGVLYERLGRGEEADGVWRRGWESARREFEVAVQRLAQRAPRLTERIARALR
ncbi:MAG: serine/threonine-protein kinase [Planctomycetota bacterium]